MARMLDLLHPSESRRPRAEFMKAEPVADEPSGDDENVPYIEVGAPSPSNARKPVRIVSPNIIQMPRPARSNEPVHKPSTAYFHIAFQPLPFPGRPEGPMEQRVARELVAFHDPEHAVSEQYRHLLAEIESQHGQPGGKTLLFASAMPSAGTTSVLLNLAVSRAQEHRVAIVDANFQRPAIAERLGAANSPGLCEVLARTVPLTWAVQETGQPNLHVLPAGIVTAEPPMDLWPVLLDQLRQRFDWVLIDGGECGARSEWPALAGTATATYLVLRQADLERAELNEVLGDVARHGGNLRGYVLTTS